MKKAIKIVANIDAVMARKIDAERIRKGSCSRAAIVRMALLDRYRERTPSHKREVSYVRQA